MGAHRGSYVAGVSILDSTRRVAAASTACRHKGASRERAGRSSAVQLHECCAWPACCCSMRRRSIVGVVVRQAQVKPPHEAGPLQRLMYAH